MTIPNMRARLRYQSPDLETESLRVAIGMQRAERDDQALNRQGTDGGLVHVTHLTDTPVGCQHPHDGAPVTAPRNAIPGWVPQCTSAAGFSRHEDVEAAFKAHPAIDDAVVLDADDGARGHNVVAVCSWAVGHTETVDDVLRSVRSRTSVDKTPGSIIVVDAIPRTGVDTVDWIAIGQIVSVSRLLHPALVGPAGPRCAGFAVSSCVMRAPGPPLEVLTPVPWHERRQGSRRGGQFRSWTAVWTPAPISKVLVSGTSRAAS